MARQLPELSALSPWEVVSKQMCHPVQPIDPPILFLVCVGRGGGESLVLRPQLIDGVAHRARALLVQLAVLGPELEVEHLQEEKDK